MLAHNSLANYYMLMHTLNENSKYSIDFIESVYPYERDIYVGLIQNDIEKKNQNKENKILASV